MICVRLSIRELTIFFPDIETRTVLVDVGQVAMAEDDGIGIVHLQRLEQMPEGSLLGLGTGVGGTSLGGETTLVADTDGVLVVVADVTSRQVLMTRLVRLTVAGDVIVIASEPEASIVAGNKVLDREPTVGTGGRTVNNN